MDESLTKIRHERSKKDFPHLLIPVITLISPLCFKLISLFKYKSLFINLQTPYFMSTCRLFSKLLYHNRIKLSMLSSRNYPKDYPKNFITMVTKNGNCKKIDLDDCIAASPSGIFYIKVDPDDAVKQAKKIVAF